MRLRLSGRQNAAGLPRVPIPSSGGQRPARARFRRGRLNEVALVDYAAARPAGAGGVLAEPPDAPWCDRAIRWPGWTCRRPDPPPGHAPPLGMRRQGGSAFAKGGTVPVDGSWRSAWPARIGQPGDRTDGNSSGWRMAHQYLITDNSPRPQHGDGRVWTPRCRRMVPGPHLGCRARALGRPLSRRAGRVGVTGCGLVGVA